MPESVETPAPVSTSQRRSPRTSASRAGAICCVLTGPVSLPLGDASPAVLVPRRDAAGFEPPPRARELALGLPRPLRVAALLVPRSDAEGFEPPSRARELALGLPQP